MSKLYGTKYVCIAVLAAALIFPANAANYDGRWVGEAPPAGEGDCGTLSVVMNVNGNTIIDGAVSGKHRSVNIKSTALPKSGVVTVWYNKFHGNVTFSGSKFSGSFMSECGIRQVVGARS